MNDFSVHRIIGRGGFGEVYGCRKADTGKMYAMKCLDKKRIKMKQGETLALNERIMLSLVSTGVSFVLHSTHTHARRESSAPSHPRASDSVRPPASPFIIPGAAPHYCCSRCLLSNFNYIRNQSSVCTSEWVRLMMQRERVGRRKAADMCSRMSSGECVFIIETCMNLIWSGQTLKRVDFTPASLPDGENLLKEGCENYDFELHQKVPLQHSFWEFNMWHFWLF